ncbi:uncharacterized protein DNG_06146 [Cephalotrichum gorgonifer]|uniref:Uncharacterized protein n=1 Tax=Cephalotrichum gorgonifer TaxID=2041049 RepID=A0AAE8SW94_9PEZI|nr:uncharacterized protein DNG_06146 [Cephalotrichum gorgonifer]
MPRPLVSDSPSTSSTSSTSGTKRVNIRAQVHPTTGSLLDICAQELFASLTMSLTAVINIEPTTASENNWSIQLNNPTLSTFAKAFVESGLGSHSEALLCLLLASRTRFTPRDMVSIAIQAAGTYRKASEWRRAVDILHWACQWHADDPPELARGIRATVEVYFWVLARWTPTRDSEGSGRIYLVTLAIEGLLRTYGSDSEIAELLMVYWALKKKLTYGSRFRQDSSVGDDSGIQGTTHARYPLIEALQDQDKLEALYRLCLVTTDESSSEPLRLALPLAVRNDVQGERRNDWVEVVNILLEMTANLNGQDEGGRTAISFCAEFGHELHAERLIRLGADLDQPDLEERTPLHFAAQSGGHNVIKLLLDSWTVNISAKDQDDATPLLVAARNGHTSIVKLLLQRGAYTEAKDRSGSTPLLGAAMRGHADTVKLLLEKGPDIEARDNDRNTPLLTAVMNGHEPVAKVLLEKGADIEATESKYSMRPLLKAAMDGNEAIVNLLLRMGADIEAMDSTYSTPLLWAARNGHEGVVKLLLDKGADVKATDGNYMTPLQRATTNGHEGVVKLLVEKGAMW